MNLKQTKTMQAYRLSFVLILLLLINQAVIAQVSTLDTQNQLLREIWLDGSDLPPDLEGTPYDNDEFQTGKIFINNAQSIPALLRYNAFEDYIEVKDKNGIYALLKRDYVHATIKGEKYAVFLYLIGKKEVKEGYFVPLTQGPIILLKKKSKMYYYGSKGDGIRPDKPARFEDKTYYYLKVNDDIPKEVKLRKKSILGVLGNTGKTNKIIKEKDLNISEESNLVLLIKELNKTSRE
ncbi:hypothetical protein [Lentiprolixibacter aurantiacus]|uniref:Uncharacterized protein n=1 Tax=Lentiprolixibacter aurantiacus TaxID=2993939 RepID=A0AAE3MKE6_9FLAO|nr:hypothetical protein [Lentiprolixibacter aurantiacus]MCX2719073.1 hypothetical protein [Lentiprolixibacter aurantiacus]